MIFAPLHIIATAIVSPAARPITRMKLAVIPDFARECGSAFEKTSYIPR